ncbi:uncharacterized protein CCOS01_13960 [Colletotrichum costaricense]|uniref:Uncharacterized protein n=1 Tax=Colletotrichum costaricense TaxID=1209916 RepID=A0AAJ0DUY9_9PEZI|nr:uncharacterized protein CCOS01_13960 [Colletotrichum costaricense]KAK1514020.1 hypothetical protein CCOS01_13960 [Colletotrichum costaricense]
MRLLQFPLLTAQCVSGLYRTQSSLSPGPLIILRALVLGMQLCDLIMYRDSARSCRRWVSIVASPSFPKWVGD